MLVAWTRQRLASTPDAPKTGQTVIAPSITLPMSPAPTHFAGSWTGWGGLGEEALLGVIFDLEEVEPAPDLLCRHDARLGDCYLTDVAEFPGMARTPWELRAAAYSLGIPLN